MVKKRGVYKPLFNFTFDILSEVICEHASSSGYLLRVVHEGGSCEDAKDGV